MPTTPYLLIDHIVQSQAQKEVTANTAFNELERAICEEATKSVAGSSNVTLTDSEARSAVLKLTGALTGNIDVIVPTRDKPYLIENATTGAFTLRVKTSDGTGVYIEQGYRHWLLCDGTNVVNLLRSLLTVSKTITAAAYTVSDTDSILYLDCTSNSITVTLPAAAGNIGRKLLFVRVDGSANTCTIQRAGADDINSASTSKTITNTIGTGLQVEGYSASRWMAQTLTAA